MSSDLTTHDVDKTLAGEYIQLTDREHGIEKSMYLGSHKVSSYDVYHTDGDTMIMTSQRFSQVFYKMFDEILVNAMDVFMEHGTVKTIRIAFDKSNGMISIYNDGVRGIPTGIVTTSDGKPIYLPEMLFTQFRSGSHHKKCKKGGNADNISTGTNGVGGKLVSINSKYLKLDTYDIDRKTHYTQIIEDRMDKINPPNISTISDTKQNGTTIEFIAEWSAFEGWPHTFDDTIYSTMDSIFRARCIFASSYLGIPIMYNADTISVLNAEALSKYFIPKSIKTTVKPKQLPPNTTKKYPWDIVIGVTTTPTILSVVNGACVYAGQHLDHIVNSVVVGLKPRIEQLLKQTKGVKYSKRMITNNISIIMIGIIPHIEFDSQLKTKLVCPDSFVEHYVLKPSFIKDIWSELEPVLYEQYMVVDKKTNVRRVLATRSKDYEPAMWAGKSNKETYLFPIEGHSAASMVRRCLISPDVAGLSFKNCGIYCLGGVTSNVQGEVTVNIVKGRRVVTMSKKIKDAPKFNAFLKIMNLDPAIDYMDPADIAKLTYTKIVFMTDADVDGVGNICGIALSNIQLMWPGLFHHAVIYRLSTPVQRWYPTSSKSFVVNFYREHDAAEWMTHNLDKRGVLKYFKGLATHSNEDAINIFQSFDKLLTVYRSTPDSDTITSHVFGPDPTMRKIYHSVEPNMTDEKLNTLYETMSIDGQTPLDSVVRKYVTYEPKHTETSIEKSMTVEHHMLTFSMEYQYANNNRSLPHIIDGLLRTHRKCIYAGLIRNSEIKVFQMGGLVALETAYHHGSASVEGCLIKLAQCFPGANNIPMFIPIGQFGSRARGGTDCGSSRYISTIINKVARLLFRPEDTYILTYTKEDGELVEPDYFVPVFPHALNVNHDNIAHAWYTHMYARDHAMIMSNIYRMIDKKSPIYMKPGLWGWKGHILQLDGVEYSLGDYWYDVKSNVLHITELPFQVWNTPYVYSEKTGILNNEYVAGVEDHSSDDKIDIRVSLKPDAFDAIIRKYANRTFDPIMECFKLRSKLNINMNFLSPSNGTLHFSKYEDMLRPWFDARYDLYKKRVSRQIIITTLQIEYMENLIRFVDGYDTYNVATGKHEADADKFLHDHKFIRFNKPLMDDPKFTPIDVIVSRVKHGDNASFEYIKAAHHPTQRTPKQCKANVEKLNTLRSKLIELNDPHAVIKIWMVELHEYDVAIQHAMKHGWVTKKNKYK